jgi:hypothetical protein
MDTLYRWRVQEKDKFGRVRWRLLRSPMTEETARFWAANNERVIQRVDLPVRPLRVAQRAPVAAARAGIKPR